ncbi:MAG: PAS domain S-box protein [Geminicoccaceae bacterium]|nr:PAS domain S-box protein [Geminicoccaceae bacterium]
MRRASPDVEHSPEADVLASPERLRALEATGLLDLPADPALDRLAKIAGRLVGSRVALVSLVGTDTQHFAGQHGLGAPLEALRRTPLAHSFCRRVVRSGRPLIVEDARDDARVRDIPGFSGLDVVAYLGVPLVARDGQVLGALCAVEPQPRAWSGDDVEAMELLARSVTTEIDTRLQLRTLERLEAREAFLLDLAQEMVELEADPDALLGRATAMVADRTQARSVHLAVADPHEGTLRLQPGGAMAPDAARDAAADIPGRGRCFDETGVVRDEEATHLIVPLQHGRAPGSFLIAACDRGRRWSEHERSLCRAAGEMIWQRFETARFARRLRESESRLRRVLDNLFAFVGVLAPDGRLLEANRAPLDALGVTLEEVRGAPFWTCGWWTHDATLQAAVREATARAARGETRRFDAEIRTAGDGRMTIDFQIAPLRDAEGCITHLIPSGVDITDRKIGEQKLRASEERMRVATAAARFGTFTTDLETGENHWSAEAKALIGLDADEPTPVERIVALIHPDDRARVTEAMARAFMADGSGEFEQEHRFVHADGHTVWVLARAKTLVEGEGARRRAVAAVGALVDLTERREAEERQRLLMREVDHRAKNALAVVQSVVRLTRADDPALYVSTIEGRIGAVARAHTLLAENRWRDVDLRRLLTQELRARDGDALHLDGAAVAIAADAAQPLALALHELATNAARHGALSSPRGRLIVVWSVEPRGDLRLTWTEEGGPPVVAPDHRRFGTRLIEATVATQLGGRFDAEWREMGLVVRIVLPASRLATRSRSAGAG